MDDTRSGKRKLRALFLLSILIKILFRSQSDFFFSRKKGALSFLSGPAALLILCGSVPSSRRRARIPQFSVATGRCGCEYKCFRKKRLCDSNCSLTMAAFSFCQMVSSVFEYTCSAGDSGWMDGRVLTQGDMGTGRERAGNREGAADAQEATVSFSHIVPGWERMLRSVLPQYRPLFSSPVSRCLGLGGAFCL